MENMTNLRRKILFYMHAGSGNHGCEAIVRSLCEILNEYEVTLLTHNIDEDRKYGLDKICKLVPVRRVEDSFLAHVYYYALKKLFHKGEPRMAYEYKNAGDLSQYEYAVSIGGDNYCYEDALYDLRMANSMFHKKGVKTALVGCSVEPSLLDRPEILADMNLYDVIVTREQVTHEALKVKLSSEMSDSNTNLYMTLDPAFVMKCDECTLPDGFVEGHTIGINVSPMILNYENPNNSGVTLENYKNLIKTILDETSDVIALIPHVVNRFSDDRKPIDTLFSFNKELVDANPQYAGRVLVVEDRSAEQLKYVISKCRLLITARTHASIAAYSTYVPTLVVGYSVKAQGIAMELFGQTENFELKDYVLPVQSLSTPMDLVAAFEHLQTTADRQKSILEEVVEPQKKKIYQIAEWMS